MDTIRVSILRSSVRAAQGTSRRATPRSRGYATDHSRMDTANKPSRLPILLGGAGLLIGGGLYAVQSGQKNVKHNDHAAQAGGANTQSRGLGGRGVVDESKSNLPSDAPNHPSNLAASQEKMQNKTPTKKTDPLK